MYVCMYVCITLTVSVCFHYSLNDAHYHNLEIIARTIELCWLFATMRGIGCLDAVNDDTIYMVMTIMEMIRIMIYMVTMIVEMIRIMTYMAMMIVEMIRMMIYMAMMITIQYYSVLSSYSRFHCQRWLDDVLHNSNRYNSVMILIVPEVGMYHTSSRPIAQ